MFTNPDVRHPDRRGAEGIVKLKGVLTQHVITTHSLDPEQPCEVEYVDAWRLLRPERLDLVSKIKYIDNKLNGRGDRFIDEIGRAHV